MSEKEIDAMVYNKHLEIIKGVVAPAIMTENYLQAYREGIKDTIQKMMKEAIDAFIYKGGIRLKEWPLPEKCGEHLDSVKVIIIKED